MSWEKHQLFTSKFSYSNIPRGPSNKQLSSQVFQKLLPRRAFPQNCPAGNLLYNPTIKTSSQRLQRLSNRLQSPTISQNSKMAERDPITCHILDTTTGRPAANVLVELSCPSFDSSTTFSSTTNVDGRIIKWSTSPYSTTRELIQSIITDYGSREGTDACPTGSSIWKLTFHTGTYYGWDKTFFPIVELTFLVKDGEHFHVPLLLGPYSYTTYRGS